MVLLIIIALLLYATVCSRSYLTAKQRAAIYWSDYATPLLVVVIWLLASVAGFGRQSLSQIVEIPIALFISAVFFHLRVFVLDKLSIKYQTNSIVFLSISLITVVLLRYLMPFIPE